MEVSVYPARLIKRYKRFLADVSQPDGQVLTVYTPNPGSMLSCCEAGREVFLERSSNPKRKYAYSWHFIDMPDGMVGVNPLYANELFAEALEQRSLNRLNDYKEFKREVKIDQSSRLDFCLDDASGLKTFVEVKSVTLQRNGGAAFPDAVSKRATKHMQLLERLVEQQHKAMVVFVVQREGCNHFECADDIDLLYGQNLRSALSKGVEAMALAVSFERQANKLRLSITHELPLHL